MANTLTASQLTAAGFSHAFSTRDGTLPFEPIYQVNQVHGAALAVADDRDLALIRAQEADAIAAEPKTKRAVGIRVADCVPVLLADKASGRVVAAHAGWRGVEAGILKTSTDHLGRGAEIIAAIGPCIGVCCFEVGQDVADRIAAVSTPRVVRENTMTKPHVDLRLAVRTQLERLGVEKIEDVPGCTRCEEQRFHSYRRDGASSGRNIAVIRASD